MFCSISCHYSVTATFSLRVALAKRSPSERPLDKPYNRLFKTSIQPMIEPMQVIRQDQGRLGPADIPETQRWVEPGNPVWLDDLESFLKV
jgi:hypothetical protein